MTDKKYKEFWLYEDKKDIQTFGMAGFEEQKHEDDIHVIEHQAYQELLEKVNLLEAKIKKAKKLVLILENMLQKTE